MEIFSRNFNQLDIDYSVKAEVWYLEHSARQFIEDNLCLGASRTIAISESRELPGMNLFYLHKNPEWRPSYRPKILDLPSTDDLDDIQQQL